MDSSKIISYSTWEPLIDTATFAGSSLAACALQGISIANPIAIGSLVIAGVNALAISFVSKIFKTNSYFSKAFIVITAVAVNTAILPYLLGMIGINASVFLSYQLAIRFGLIHIITKVAVYGFYQIVASLISKKQIKAAPSLKVEIFPPQDKEIAITKVDPQFFKNILEKKEKYPISDLITQNINWKKVGIFTLLGTLIIIPMITLLATRTIPAIPKSTDLIVYPLQTNHSIPEVLQVVYEKTLTFKEPIKDATINKTYLFGLIGLSIAGIASYAWKLKSKIKNTIPPRTIEEQPKIILSDQEIQDFLYKGITQMIIDTCDPKKIVGFDFQEATITFKNGNNTQVISINRSEFKKRSKSRAKIKDNQTTISAKFRRISGSHKEIDEKSKNLSMIIFSNNGYCEIYINEKESRKIYSKIETKIVIKFTKELSSKLIPSTFHFPRITDTFRNISNSITKQLS